jgi:two-component system OmpR family sensor kinase/two-component system sensor histidine kinase QseC
LINLVDNAIKFAPHGERIRIRVAEAGSHAIVDVIDTGPGIPADARARIFDRFYRVDGVEPSGSGLGLSIARGAIESSGGHLTLEETGAQGSTFRITLPRAGEAARQDPARGRHAARA